MRKTHHGRTSKIQCESRRKAISLVVSGHLLISKESLHAMIGDGLARMIAAHIGKNLLQKACRRNRRTPNLTLNKKG